MRIQSIGKILFLATAFSGFGRKYTPGETYRYQLTSVVTDNGKWQSTTYAKCELHVVTDSNGIPYDEIRWLSQRIISAKDTIDETAGAILVKPYRISLDPRGRIDIPRIEVPDMTGAITDLNTFFVAVSPKIGATNLEHVGDTIAKKEYAKGDFSNGKTILKGEDCLAVTTAFTRETKDTVFLHSAFMPPPQPCLSYLLTGMDVPVVRDTINNFQMIRPTGKNRYNVLFGTEWFTIDSRIYKSDGKVTSAEMTNRLTLKIRVNCDSTFKNPQAELPFIKQRLVRLELLPG